MNELTYIENLIKNIELRIVNKKKNGFNYIIYEVPNFMLGLPLYDSIKIAKILKKELIKKKYNVKYLYENKIYIYWEPKKKEYSHIPKLLDRLKQKIILNAQKDLDNCIFEIPAFIPGLPLFDSEEAAIIIKNDIKKCGFICKIIYNNQLFVSWNIFDIEEKNNMEIIFRTDKEKRKLQKRKFDNLNKNKLIIFKNPDKTNEENENELENEKLNKYENGDFKYDSEDEGFDKYFDINSSCSDFDKMYPEASTFYRYFENPPPKVLPQHQHLKKHTKSYKNNTKSFFPIEYTDPPIKSKIIFKNETKNKNKINKKRLDVFLNPNYTSHSSSLSKDNSILNKLESLKNCTSKLKK